MAYIILFMDPIFPNPGGHLDLHDIVGREKEVARYWRILTRQSLVLGAERRLGKEQSLTQLEAVLFA